MSRPLQDDETTTQRPLWLLRHAEQLAARTSGTELPRTAHPRRAVLVAAARQSAEMRNERELADYSHEVVIDRDAALTMIGHARSAVDALDAVAHDEPAWQAFVALMLMESKPRTYQLPVKGDAGR